MMEFHVSRTSRDKYQFDQQLFSFNGNVIFANFQASRVFAQKMNAHRVDSTNHNDHASACQINALGLIDEIFHLIVSEYLQECGQSIRGSLYLELLTKIGSEKLDATLVQFTQLFPPVAVYQGQLSAQEYLAVATTGVPNRETTLDEIMMLWLTNMNPAADPYQELFEDSDLMETTAYSQVIDGIQIFFKTQPTFGPEKQDLVTMLRTPAMMVPQSLGGQLEFIQQHWSKYLGKFLYKLLGSLDMIKEEQRMIFAGPNRTQVPEYSSTDLAEVEHFSPDSDWMPKVIMMAKNSFVWLNQLSREYQRPIERLDQIPDETLDQLARWGFTGLWLIGLWERSDASRRIKQMCGNPDAVSSAYSLARYQIASRLGGEEAYNNLSYRAGQRGIRLASDMVPNHMGIDSDWVYDHPDWFVSQDYSPFPGYTFNSPDLSENPNVSITLEDHYYSRSDAAVVFKRYDHSTGQEQYIYHGNDGTSMPWNDTAQLNYLKPEVREAVIQTILSVARKFPIIRFDAAMTLTKKHYQRLWFPQPGTGGDIPSRAEHAMTKEAFDQAMPEEFWREVVERVAKEVPDTLLLAEAFWLMEGYFVRTLGMHRVYNSAFMNMLRNEENEKYRQLIKNTLVFDPQILKRYVNFMNNPDEKTAVEQFGKGDKYFGICTVMSTMPGLPMFGHGQVEGYAEKYGMEYYRPYWDETPDSNLVRRHETDIFPILHKRRLFANVENFMLYDFHTSIGTIDENTFAYSNSDGNQSALVIYRNCFGSMSGWIKTSNPFLIKDGDNSHLETRDVCNALQLKGGADTFVIFKDYIGKLEYIRSVQEIREKGLYFSLAAYSHHVYMDFREVQGSEFEKLNAYLNGRGVSDLEAVKRDLVLSPILDQLGKAINPDNLKALINLGKDSHASVQFHRLLKNNLVFLGAASEKIYSVYHVNESLFQPGMNSAETCIIHIVNLQKYDELLGLKGSKLVPEFIKSMKAQLAEDPRREYVLLIWGILSNLVGPAFQEECVKTSRSVLEEEAVSRLITETLKGVGYGDYEAYKACQAIKWMTTNTNWFEDLPSVKASQLLDTWMADPQFKEYIEVNEYNGFLWFNKEKFESMLWYMRTATIIRHGCLEDVSATEHVEVILASNKIFENLKLALDASNYQVNKLMENLV